MRLIDRTALVTGASRGIGRAIALALATEGADVAVNYLCSETPAKQLVKEIEAMGCKALLVQGDVGNYDDAERMARDWPCLRASRYFNQQCGYHVRPHVFQNGSGRLA